ncbi:MAG TPA: DUF2382 domain-containing protein [Allosphingosinicella sp.]|jgi:hypothetical protein
MIRSVNAQFESRAEAEAAAARLERSHLAPEDLRIDVLNSAVPAGAEPGLFDRFADWLLPRQGRPRRFRVSANVDEPQADEAIRILHEEPVQPIILTGGGGFGGGVVEMAETAEEIVVTKQAVVREEVVLTREATECAETVHDTLRHTEVEVKRIAPPPPPRQS